MSSLFAKISHQTIIIIEILKKREISYRCWTKKCCDSILIFTISSLFARILVNVWWRALNLYGDALKTTMSLLCKHSNGVYCVACHGMAINLQCWIRSMTFSKYSTYLMCLYVLYVLCTIHRVYKIRCVSLLFSTFMAKFIYTLFWKRTHTYHSLKACWINYFFMTPILCGSSRGKDALKRCLFQNFKEMLIVSALFI